MAGQPPLVFANPTVNPPRLPSPSKHQRYHSRSASRSPVRRYQARDFDPILRNLSPTSTLRAFSSNQDVSPRRNSLDRSFDTSTSAQRALGAKAAQACLDVRTWTRELEAWDWSGSFDVPEPASKRQKLGLAGTDSLKSRHSIKENPGKDEEDIEFWGSLPAQTVRQREQRTDEIAQQLDEVDVEELKCFVLAAHQEVGTGTADVDDSIGAIAAATDLRRLDDFTAIITATILQALPYLSRLNHLLDLWTIRLSVLRHTPDFLKDLNQARTDLEHGWASIAVAPAMGSTDDHHAMFTRSIMTQMQELIESRVASIGRRLDGFLDDLEGREETVPESWIEDLDSLEEKYAEWTVQAEKKLLENEINQSRWEAPKSLPIVEETSEVQSGATDEHGLSSGLKYVASDSDNVSLPDQAILAQLSLTDSRTVSPIASSHRTASPRGSLRDNLVAINAHQNATPREPSPLGPGLDERPVLPRPENSEQHETSPNGLARDDSQTIPSPLASRIVHDGSTIPLSRSSSNKENKARHVPILLAYDGDGQEYPVEGITGDVSSRTVSRAVDPVKSSSPIDAEVPPVSIVKKRTAFLGDVERNNSLQRATKSPVRPFEHASNAFTRLFKKDRSPEHSRTRSNSARSTSSNEKRRSGSLKRGDDGVVWGGRSPVEGARGRLNGSSVGAKSSSISLVSKPKDKAVPADSAAPPMPVLPTTSKRVPKEPPREVPAPFEADNLLPALDGAPAPSESERPTSFTFAENWPLVSPEGPTPGVPSPEEKELPPLPSDDEHEDFEGSPEIASPKQAMGSDDFHRRFIDSLPSTPSERLATSPTRQVSSPDRSQKSLTIETESPARKSTPPTMHEDDELSRAGSKLRRHEENRPKSTVPTVEDFMLDDSAGPRPPPKSFPLSDEPFNGLDQFDFGSTSPMPEQQAEDVLTPGSMASDMSSPEIENASIGYFPLQPSPAESRANSIAAASPAKLRPASSSSLSPMALRLHIPSSERNIDEDGETEGRPNLISRASMASIESHPRSELKAIDLHRRSTPSATNSAPISPSKSEKASPISQRGLLMFPSPPNGRVSSLTGRARDSDSGSGGRGSRSRSPVSPLDESPDMRRGKERMASPLANLEELSPTADKGKLNSFMGKRRVQATSTKRPTSKKGRLATSNKVESDSFDRHVSEVLESIPAPIRFRSGAETPQPRSSEPRNYSGPRPKNARLSSRTLSSGLTLAPAEISPKKSHSANEPEVKLYHLTQAGREEPIKLFVRLVGENERVMVRVGGGWADLADYLRQYAEHHGSRTVSEGNVDVQTVSAAVAATSGAGRRVSGPLKASPMTLVIGSRPGSKDEAEAGGGASAEVWGRPQSRFSMANSPTEVGDTPTLVSPSTSSRPSLPTSTSTSTPTRSSRPSTADAANSASRPGSRQAWSELSTAGTHNGSASKRPDLPEHKAKWVDSMLERVTKASAEKTKEERERKFPFGEMGKVGGTRRVVFRGASGAQKKAQDEIER